MIFEELLNDNRLPVYSTREILRKVKYLLLLLLLGSIELYGHMGDILILNNQQVYRGKVTKVKECLVTFKTGGDKYVIPATDIYSIEFKDKSDKAYLKYLNELEINPHNCVNGRLDAAQYHGKKSSHIALGFLFGPLALLGTAMSNPTPEKGQLTTRMSNHSELFSDPDYLDCYRRKAKGKLIGAESIGFGISVLMILLITPTYLAGK